MQTSTAPWLGGRYWIALLLASSCATNLGDLLPDVLNLKPLEELGACIALVAVGALGALAMKGREVFFWLAALMLCAAATALADLAVNDAHLGFAMAGAGALVLLVMLLMVQSMTRAGIQDPFSTNALFWITFLIAGVLGTILADGIGHAFPSVKIGVPVSALLATLAVLAAVGTVVRYRLQIGIAYWAAIVAARWWGTNIGDIVKFLTSFAVSIGVFAVLLLLVLFLWRARGESNGVRTQVS